MPRCSNCSYILVLLEKRRRFKCAKCSSLFSQKLIESADFRKWNKWQRESDKKSLKKSRDKEWRKNNPNWLKEWRKKYYEKNKEKLKRLSRQNYYKNKRKILLHKKVYRQMAKQKYYEWRANYRNINRGRARLLTRIYFWRQKQKKLALEMIENYILRDTLSYNYKV